VKHQASTNYNSEEETIVIGTQDTPTAQTYMENEFIPRYIWMIHVQSTGNIQACLFPHTAGENIIKFMCDYSWDMDS
jgi:hypothetical protein